MKEIDLSNTIIVLCILGILGMLCKNNNQSENFSENFCQKCNGGPKLEGQLLAKIPGSEDNICVYPEEKLSNKEKKFYSETKNSMILSKGENLEDYGLKVVRDNECKDGDGNPRDCIGSWVEVENKCKDITGPRQRVNCGIKKMYTIAPHNMPINNGKACSHSNGEVKYSNCDIACLDGSDCYSEYLK
jgi:hypothetical protein